MRTSLSIHTAIMLLVIGTALPFLVFSGLLVNRSAADEQALIAQTVRNAAQGAAADLNRQLKALQSLAVSLAGSRLLQTGDLAGFHAQAAETARGEELTAVLYDPAGRQLVDTSMPFGAALPADPAMAGRVVEAGQADISDLATDARTGRRIVSIAAPVMRDGALAYILNLLISNSIAAVMADQIVPPEQTVGLVDRQAFIIYRTHESDRFIGLQAPADFVAKVRGLDEGSFDSVTRDGIPNYVAFSRVKLTGWVLGVSIPRHVLFAPVTHSLLRLLALGAGVLLFAGLVAWAIGRAIARPVTGLSRLAVALGSGARADPPASTRVREVDAVTAATFAAAESLRQETERRSRAAAALQTKAADRRRVEQQLLQAQKMEAVGQLTGGLAHDFNNLLGIIIGNLDMLRDRWTDDPDSDELAADALDAALRGADLARQMLAFARRQPLRPERCNINRAIVDIVRLLRRTLGEDIMIDLQLASELWPALVDRLQFETAVTNLATNARDAMPGGGALTIATRNTQLDEDYAAAHAELAPGDYVSIEVRDTGTGMPPERLDRIFEPFFTTKETGQGPGLGLSMVFGFLKQSGGHINAYSEVGEGTVFRLYLPAVHDAAAPGDGEGAALPPAELGHNETVLIVEDSAGLRKTLVRQLTAAGYRVLEADSAAAALVTIEGAAVIDLLLTDIVMPGGMNGRDLAAAAVLRRPGLRTLLTSGFPEMANGGADVPSGARILRKPYRRDEMLRLVRDALDD